MDANLLDSVAEIVSGNAVYIERFHCEESDYETLERLAKDLDECSKEEEEEGMINWSKTLETRKSGVFGDVSNSRGTDGGVLRRGRVRDAS